MRWRLAIATAQGHAIAAGLFGLIKRNDPRSPLAGLAVDRVYATGWSQTGLFLQQFLDRGYHEAMAAGDDTVVDGYLIAVGPAPQHRPADAVLVNLLSEGEVVGTLSPGFTVADDTDAPRFRGYEVPGSFHHWEVKPGAQRQPVEGDHDSQHNDRPWHVVVHAILDNMDRWVRDGTPMPHAPRITRDPDAPDGVARDEYGNARGGLRTPWLDVPTARYSPRCTCSPVTGSMVPLSDAELIARYRDRDGFVDAGNVRSTRLLPSVGCSQRMPTCSAPTRGSDPAHPYSDRRWTAVPSSGSRPRSIRTTGACRWCPGSRAAAASCSAGAGSAPRARRWS